MKVFIILCTLFFSLSFALSAKAQVDQTLLAVSDTSQSNEKQAQETVKVIRVTKPIIAKMGSPISIPLDATVLSTVRLHSSLGRLIQKISGVNNEVKLKTDKLLPGVYMLIIKKPGIREIHKVLLTAK